MCFEELQHRIQIAGILFDTTRVIETRGVDDAKFQIRILVNQVLHGFSCFRYIATSFHCVSVKQMIYCGRSPVLPINRIEVR